MTKAKLKQNITKINKLLRSDNYEAGIELLKTFDDPEITKGTAKTIMAKIKKLLTQYDYDSIDHGTGILQLLSDRRNFKELLSWRKKRWIKIIENQGFFVIKIIKLPVTTGYSFKLQRFCEIMFKIGLCSSYAYVAVKNKNSNTIKYFS